jgi:hypothetical protein
MKSVLRLCDVVRVASRVYAILCASLSYLCASRSDDAVQSMESRGTWWAVTRLIDEGLFSVVSSMLCSH